MFYFSAPILVRFFSALRKSAAVFCSVIFCLPAVHAQTSGQTAASLASGVHPLVGTWSWSLFGGKCVETYDYRADGTLLSTSGEAVTVWTYSVTPNTSDKGFYALKATSVRQNGKKDCSGDMVEEAGTASQLFIQMSPKLDRFIACKEESLAACFGPLARVP